MAVVAATTAEPDPERLSIHASVLLGSDSARSLSLLGSLLPTILSPLASVALAAGSGGAAAVMAKNPSSLDRNPCSARYTVAAFAIADRMARASLRVLAQVLTFPAATKAWKQPVGRLFGLASFFSSLTYRSLPLWSKAAAAWLTLETPKAAMAMILSGKMGRIVGWHAEIVPRRRREHTKPWPGFIIGRSVPSAGLVPKPTRLRCTPTSYAASLSRSGRGSLTSRQTTQRLHRDMTSLLLF